MGWLNNIINKAKEKVKNAVNGAVQTGQQAMQNVTSGVQNIGTAVQNAVQTGQQVVQNTAQGVQNAVQGAVQQGQQAVQNIVQNASQSVADKVNSVNDQIQGTQNNASSVTQVVPSSPAGEGSGTQTPSTVPQTAPSTTPEQNNTSSVGGGSGSSFDTSEPILTYEDYLKREESGLGYIKDETTKLLDKQSTETLEHIDQQLESDNEYAEDVKTTTETSLQKEKDEVYAYVDKMLGDTLAYNNESYNALIENITGLMEQGKIQAGEAKELLIQIAEETKNATYGAAERQREEAERQANINRQRAISDANSAYEQNKASYGAKAEALGNMGLAGGGYGDWLNATAYAQNRSEVQGARAQSDKAKTDAKYTEDMTKLDADLKYSDQKQQAESDYLSKVHDIDTTYATNLGEAEQWKLKADKDARDAADATKRQVDSDYNTGKLQSDLTYSEMLHGFGKQSSENELKVNQDTDAKKLQAEIDYVTGILNNSKDLAEYKESLKAGDAAAEEKKLAVYEQLLAGVNNGTYDAETAEALADAFGLGEAWKNAISGAAGRKEETDAGIKAERDHQQKVQNFGTLLEKGKTGALTSDEIKAMASELGFDNNDPNDAKLIDLAVKAADGYATASDEEKQYQKSMNALTVLEGAKNGTYTAEEIPQIATMLGLDSEKDSAIITMLTDAATDFANGVTKTEDQQKTSAFLNLLGSANNGELTSEEIAYLASKMGLSDEDISLLKAAAERFETGTNEAKTEQKTMNFISLLDAANTGAYNSAQVEQMATMLGLKPAEGEEGTEGYKPNDQALIDMLKTAATDFANGEAGKTAKEDMQYQNAIYAELLAAANNGDYTEDQIKALAERFGIEDTDGILAGAARLTQESKKTEDENLVKRESAANALEIKGMLTGDTSDEYIDDYVDAGYITEADANKLKEDRNTVAKKEIDDLVKSANYAGAIERAEDLKELGYIDTDTYQSAYFGASLNNCEQAKTIDQIDDVTAELKNQLNAGKISQKDYNNLVSYMYKNAGKKLDSSASYTMKDTWYGDTYYEFSVGSKTYEYKPWNSKHVQSGTETDDILNTIAGGTPKGTLVMFDGQLYISNGTGWAELKDKNGLYEEYNKQVARQAKPTAPKHQAGSSTNEGYVNPGAAAHGR